MTPRKPQTPDPSRQPALGAVGVLGALGAIGLMVILAGCGGPPTETAAETATETGTAEQADAGAGLGAEVGNLPIGDEVVDLDPARFTATIDHRFWPMEPGARWVYREVDEEGAELEVVVTVSSETMTVAEGVTGRVVRDTVYADGELIEDTLDWYAQDEAGNVWYLGEDTAEFEDGEITTRAGSFEAGVDGALAGVILPADPQPGQRYRQEYYEGQAEDNGEVLSLQEMAEVPTGFYDEMLLTKDTVGLEPRVLEYKLYAPDVGPVLALGVSGGAGREELVSTEKVSPRTAAAAGTAPLGEPYD